MSKNTKAKHNLCPVCESITKKWAMAEGEDGVAYNIDKCVFFAKLMVDKNTCSHSKPCFSFSGKRWNEKLELRQRSTSQWRCLCDLLNLSLLDRLTQYCSGLPVSLTLEVYAQKKATR